MQYAPTRSRYKIYLIDEVHMLSAHSFNALLKTLEEPPPHVKFLLATTEPQKLPVDGAVALPAVQSQAPAGGADQRAAARISCRPSSIAFEPAAVQLLAQAGDGSLRDALSLLDQLLAYGNGKALEADARAMLGTVRARAGARAWSSCSRRAMPAALLDYARALDERARLRAAARSARGAARARRAQAAGARLRGR